MRLAVFERGVKIIKGFAGPEDILKPIHRILRAGIEERFVDDNAPAPDGCAEQTKHDKFNHKGCLIKHRPERDVA